MRLQARHPKRTTGGHATALGLVTALTAGLMAAVAPPAAADLNALSILPSGGTQVVVGPSSAVYIDGRIAYSDACTQGGRKGIDDFVMPATDVYVVHAGSASPGATLTDASGANPNTVVGTGAGGAVMAELIAVTTPGGRLGEGVFDIVYDTCQDGVVGPDDTVFPAAITVDVPDGELPPLDGSLAAIKEKARLSYQAWLQTHTGMAALFKIEDAIELLSCLAAPSPDCFAMTLAVIYDRDSINAQNSDYIEGLALGLVANVAKNYGAIWQDPPDPAFASPTVVDPVTPVADVPAAGAPVADALTAAMRPLAQEAALSQALLHAVERYQGAQAAGDADGALLQARGVRDLSSTLRDHLASSGAVDALRDASAAQAATLTERSERGFALSRRVRDVGFTADERRGLLNVGLSAAAVGDLESRLAAGIPDTAPTGEALADALSGVVAARTGMREVLEQTAADWDGLVQDLVTRTSRTAPVADAGGPYRAADADAIVLDGSRSTVGDGRTVTEHAWDLDGDGEFDDASGVRAPLTPGGSRTIGLRVTDSTGAWAVDYAVVAIDGGDRPPALDSGGERTAVVEVGAERGFEVLATDPDGDALTYAWTVGGQPVSEPSARLTLRPTVEQVGEHVVTVTVTGGAQRATRSWAVRVVDVDADRDGWTRTSDCDDTRADSRPGGIERNGNGRDDDCDAGTPDEPPGGITGTMWGWGSWYYLPAPLQESASPQRYDAFGDQVRAIEAGEGQGFAVLADETVRGWGSWRGDGRASSQDRRPVQVQVSSGEPLDGVTEVTADSRAVLALRGADGSVMAWGENGARMLGDGTDVATRGKAVPVVDERDRPLTGVASVETGEGLSFAVMRDGSLRVWGYDWCNGGGVVTPVNHAVVNARYGTGVVQVASGDGGMALVRKADGSVWSCGADSAAYAGRGASPGQLKEPGQLVGFGPGSGAVDVAFGAASGAVLKDDGSVWTWGRNLNSVLDVIGLPHDAVQYVPVRVPLPPGPPVVDIEMDDAVTTFARRADGSVLVWGANVIGSAGTGGPVAGQQPVVGTPMIDLGGGRAEAVANAMWSGLAIVRPPTASVEDRPLPWVQARVEDATVSERDGGVVRLALSEQAPDAVTVTYAVDGGAPTTATVPAGSNGVDLPVRVADDELDEPDSTVTLHVLSVSDGVTTARRTAVVTVVDDDEAPLLSVRGASAVEGGTTLTDVPVEVVLDRPSGRDVSVAWATIDGTASAGSDYVPASGLLTVPAGSTHAVAHVAVRGDDDVEAHEQLSVVLREPQGAGLGEDSAGVEIRDDEPVVVQVEDVQVDEGHSGTNPAPFLVSIGDVPPGVTVQVPWRVRPGSAEAPGDIAPGEGTLRFSAEDRTPVRVEAEVVADTVAEPLARESFALELGPGTASDGRPVLPASARGTVVDDDRQVVPVVEAGPDLTAVEGSVAQLSGTAVGGPDLQVEWTSADARCSFTDVTALTSGVQCPDETDTVLTLRVRDAAGGETSDSLRLQVGNVAPTVLMRSPTEQTRVQAGQEIAPEVTFSDPGTDTLACTLDWGDGGAPASCEVPHAYPAAGSYTVTATVTDGDGGTGTARTVVVVTAAPWPFTGFHPPVRGEPAVNKVRAGSTVPVQFGLGGDHGLDIFAPGQPSSLRVDCTTGRALEPQRPTRTPGSAGLTYSAGNSKYHYPWQTDRSWSGTCRQLVLGLRDGSRHTATFSFR